MSDELQSASKTEKVSLLSSSIYSSSASASREGRTIFDHGVLQNLSLTFQLSRIDSHTMNETVTRGTRSHLAQSQQHRTPPHNTVLHSFHGYQLSPAAYGMSHSEVVRYRRAKMHRACDWLHLRKRQSLCGLRLDCLGIIRHVNYTKASSRARRSVAIHMVGRRSIEAVWHCAVRHRT